MKKIFSSIINLLLISATALCQDYIADFSMGDGYTLVHKKVPPPGQYQTEAPKTYGVINSQNRIVVPIVYKNILKSGELGIFIVSDGNNEGLYSAAAGKAITEMQYADINSFSNGLAVVKKRKPDYSFAWGNVDVNGNVVIPAAYDELGDYTNGLISFKKENKYGFIDKTNRVVIPAIYDEAYPFYDGLALVKTGAGGKYGFIDNNNNMAIAAQYEKARSFYGGFAAVSKKKGLTSGEWVVINKTGKQIQERSFDEVSSLYPGGLFIIEENKKKGTMNTMGMPILPMEYADVTIDKNGYAIFKTEAKKYGMMNNTGSIIVAPNYDYVSPTTANRFYVVQDGKYTVGDVNNNVFIQPDSANGVVLGKKRIMYYYKNKVKVFDLNGNLQKIFTDLNLYSFGNSFTETEDSIKLNMNTTAQLITLATNTKKNLPSAEVGDFNEEGIFLVKTTGYGFYDYTGKKLSTQSYSSVVNFSEGVCALQQTSASAPILADKNFNKIKELPVNFKGPYSEGIAFANNPQTGMVYYLDKKGNEVFKLEAQAGTKCSNGFILLADKNNRYFHVTKKGKTICSNTWQEAGEFNEGLAMVKENEKWGFIDTLCKKIIDTKYDVVSNFSKGAAMVKLGNDFFLINKKGEKISTATYEAAGVPGNGTFPAQKNKMAGLVDSKGNVVIDFKYKSILYMSEDRVWAVNADGKWGLLDNKGKALTEFIYDGAYDFKDGFARVLLNDKIGVVNKSGKLVLPAEFQSIGMVYKGTTIGIRPAETVFYNVK